jgi:Flp pilus assembly pilin Flp
MSPAAKAPTMKSFLVSEGGQTATEYMLIISVVVIAVAAAAYAFVPIFAEGVIELAEKVKDILDTGCINGCAATH